MTNETWEQTKERLRSRGIGARPSQPVPEPPKNEQEWPKVAPEGPKEAEGPAAKEKPAGGRFNVHRRVVVYDVVVSDKIVVHNLPSQKAAERLIEHARDSRGERVFRAIKYYGEEETKPLIYYDIVPSDLSPDDRSDYYSQSPVGGGKDMDWVD